MIEHNVNTLVVNTMPRAVFEYLQETNQLNDKELYAIEGEDIIIDANPTHGSENAVMSGGVSAALATKANSSDIPDVPEEYTNLELLTLWNSI